MKALLAMLFMFVLFAALMSDTNIRKADTQQNIGSMFFCERYNTKYDMPINVSNRFTRGNICVITNLGYSINQSYVIIQLDRLNPVTHQYEYYNSYNFTVNPSYSYIYFNNVYFGMSGHYRVFLLRQDRQVIISGLVEII